MFFARPDDSIADCSRIMSDKGAGALIVTEGRRPLGIISDSHCVAVLTGPPSISMGDILFVVMNGYVCPQCWAVEDARGSGDGYSE